ncbi:hypothetical protein HERIO_1217 [Hepatospora eriocheir]|uniref:Uncharacterized protein n=1 Tax=Hepatospora eriocheir TaxID=1081669 RepID=A0A1X0QAT3_9MICR|nr:hypothetical protein HERIO_1217 [Hepatospora eriocheir]
MFKNVKYQECYNETDEDVLKNFNCKSNSFKIKMKTFMIYYKDILVEIITSLVHVKHKRKNISTEISILSEFIQLLNNSLDFIRYYFKLKKLINQIKNNNVNINITIDNLINILENNCFWCFKTTSINYFKKLKNQSRYNRKNISEKLKEYNNLYITEIFQSSVNLN